MVSGTVKRTERGWAGHFICSHLCSFRRNTLLESADGRSLIVSTVGALRDPQNMEGVIREISYKCYYETKVFKTKQNGPYIDIDVTQEVFLDKIDPTFTDSICGESLEELHEKYKEIGIDNAANAIHEHAVNIVTKMLQETSDKNN